MVNEKQSSPYKVALISRDRQMAEELRGTIATYNMDVEVVPTSDYHVNGQSDDADVFVVALPENFRPEDTGGGDNKLTFSRRTLFLSRKKDDNIRKWAFYNGASDFIVYPFHSRQIAARIENLICSDTRRYSEITREQNILFFLTELRDRNVRSIEPVLEPSRPRGHFYPDVTEIIGDTQRDVEILEKLAEGGFLSRTLRNRMRLCTICDDYRINYREVCPDCGSIDIVRTEIVHHFSCGHMNALEKFRRGAELVCPKCDKTLRHIGLDYEKPSGYFICNSCGSMTAEPNVEGQCLLCGYTFAPEDTFEKSVFAYELTEIALNAIQNGRLEGSDLTILLQGNYPGLYSRQFFYHEVQREFARFTRYGNIFTLMMIRVEGLEDVRRRSEEDYRTYVESVFKALNTGLRTLDITCVCSEDVFGVMLSETREDGAQVVAERMYENVRSLEYLYDIRKPEITASILTADKKYASVDEMAKILHSELEDDTDAR